MYGCNQFLRTRTEKMLGKKGRPCIRAWICGECGTVHDRNVNAAKNMLAAGRRRLAEGIPAL
jgi:transposase